MSARRARSAQAAAPSRQERAVAAVLATAIEAHQRGQFETARQGYTALLEHEPENFDALHLLGVVAAQLGQPAVAVDLIGLALQVRPRSHEALGNLGMALKALGRTDEAEATLRRALDLAPRFVDALRNLAGLLQTRGANAEAILLLARAARAAPDHATVRAQLGALMLAGGDAEGAREHLLHAARLAPADVDIAANLGRACLDTDRADAGVAACERALLAAPTHVPALVTLAALERVRGRFDVAEGLALRALQCAPGHRGARINLGTVLGEMGRYDEAAAMFGTLIEEHPQDAEARTSRALIALAAGRVADAWQDHDWRWRLPHCTRPQPPAAREWTGTTPQSGRLFVWPEQGLGDEIVHASLIPDLTGRTRDVVLGCDPRLTDLYGRSFPAVHVVPAAELNAVAGECTDADRQCPLGSLAPILRPTLADFPDRAGYLVPDPGRVAGWREWLAALGDGPKVGISWRSQNRRGERRLACTELVQWASVLAVPGVRFVCLQYDECSTELAAMRGTATIHVPPRLDQRNDLEGVCALMQGLDLVVSVATTVSMLAGGVGVPTWQLARGIDWYGMGRARSPWQPAVRSIHRRWNVAWEEILSTVAHDLRALASNRVAATALS